MTIPRITQKGYWFNKTKPKYLTKTCECVKFAGPN